ncbi:fungal-specific transcription factor domain-containing protein [Desarmillaria tabescens]|uniref:Fungal-specific transcription factor domain-containing protein n=1 Tax=Armillaria tabescens TaxID=1929756 RepID=A0AA39N8H7_ARMTA|nr:fungal-specific transcription factor domain-containing protein [Desarmillaria tabescens]KAK0460990.1 fungal-specific transcription factor domain-containing protein [Desarmillaria tabescens]
MPDNVCTNCIQSHKACTYVEMSKPRGPPKAYVTGLEDRLEKMEDLLKRLWPESDFSEELGPPVIRDSWKNEDSANSADNATSQSKVKSSPFNPPAPSSFKKPDAASALFSPSVPLGFSTHLMLSDLRPQKRPRVPVRKHSSGTHGSHSRPEANASDPSSDIDELVEGFGGKGRLSLRLSDDVAEEDNSARFHGQSSSLRMVDATRKFKHLHILETSSDSGKGTPSPDFRSDSPRRAEFWHPPPWERLYEGLHVDSPEILPEILAHFPPPDLATKLIDIYFPPHQHPWRENLQNRNIWFACLTLTIFAVASRYCDDPRVLPKGVAKKENEEVDWTQAGWSFFTVALGVHRHRRSLLYPATLFEVQTFSLLAMFLRGTTSHPTAWLLIGVGIRKAQDVGAHRRTVYQQRPTVQEELWKRAFWMLIAFDRIGSAHIGRPCGFGEEDFDVDLPVEVDDEYWEPEDPNMAFRQPPDVPCTITAFNLFIKLSQIVAFTTRTIYATNPANVIMGRPIGRPEQIVSQLNAALTEWVDSVPEYLKWSSQLENPIYSNLSATLYTTYYLTQMLIYRPFIPSPAAYDGRPSNSTSSFPFPALAICTNAAKSCAHIVEEQMLRGIWNIPNLISVSHISCGMLLVGIWDLKAKERAQLANGVEDIKPPLVQALEPLIKDISIFLKALEWAAPRYETVESTIRQIKESLPSPDIDDSRPRPLDFRESRRLAQDNVSHYMSGSSESSTESQQEVALWSMPTTHSPQPIISLHPPYSVESTPPQPTRSHSVHRSLSFSSMSVLRQSFYQVQDASDEQLPTTETDTSRYSTYRPPPPSSSANDWQAPRSRVPRIASYHRLPHSSPAPYEHQNKSFVDHQLPPSSHRQVAYRSMDDSGRAMDVYDDESGRYSHPPTSDTRSIPAQTQSSVDRRVFRAPPGWDRQNHHYDEENKTSFFTWDNHLPRAFHAFPPPPTPHTS